MSKNNFIKLSFSRRWTPQEILDVGFFKKLWLHLQHIPRVSRYDKDGTNYAEKLGEY